METMVEDTREGWAELVGMMLRPRVVPMDSDEAKLMASSFSLDLIRSVGKTLKPAGQITSSAEVYSAMMGLPTSS